MICFAPLGGVIWSSWFAGANGCTLHEGFVTPCIVDGTDWGEMLYSAFVMGWLMLAMLPVAAVAGLVLLIMAFRDLLRYLRRGNRRNIHAQNPDHPLP